MNKFVLGGIEQVRIIQHTAKLTFSHDFSVKVWGAYCTSVRIIFEFLRQKNADMENFSCNQYLERFAILNTENIQICG